MFQSRNGLSLTEVLISMGILTVGLLGVASVFPVAASFMQKGDVQDRSSAIAQAAFNDAMARGVFDPANWLMYEDQPSAPYIPRTFTKRFQPRLHDTLTTAVNLLDTTPTQRLQRQQAINRAYGSAYVIDPIAVDGSPIVPADPDNRTQVRTVQTMPFNAALASYSYSSWWPWNPAAATINQPKWPLVRVTLPLSAPNDDWPMTSIVADKYFRSPDDLTMDMPSQGSRPSQTRFEKTSVGGIETPLARESAGEYSWMATVVPTTYEARNGLATDPSSHAYEVSVAVFHKRPVDNLLVDAQSSERLATVKIVSTGLNGGEVLIEKASTDSSSNPFDTLKVGKWIMLCGPSPSSTSERPLFVARWYRVLAIEKEATGIITNATNQRLVSLRGPQWPWEPAANLAATSLSNNLCACIIPNVVAVHSKTVRLPARNAFSTN